MCNKCIHKPVCSKYIATGGVNSCEHFKEERKGRWVERNVKSNKYRRYYHFFYCSECKELGDPEWKACPVCGADMRGNESGPKERT